MSHAVETQISPDSRREYGIPRSRTTHTGALYAIIMSMYDPSACVVLNSVGSSQRTEQIRQSHVSHPLHKPTIINIEASNIAANYRFSNTYYWILRRLSPVTGNYMTTPFSSGTPSNQRWPLACLRCYNLCVCVCVPKWITYFSSDPLVLFSMDLILEIDSEVSRRISNFKRDWSMKTKDTTTSSAKLLTDHCLIIIWRDQLATPASLSIHGALNPIRMHRLLQNCATTRSLNSNIKMVNKRKA